MFSSKLCCFRDMRPYLVLFAVGKSSELMDWKQGYAFVQNMSGTCNTRVLIVLFTTPSLTRALLDLSKRCWKKSRRTGLIVPCGRFFDLSVHFFLFPPDSCLFCFLFISCFVLFRRYSVFRNAWRSTVAPRLFPARSGGIEGWRGTPRNGRRYAAWPGTTGNGGEKVRVTFYFQNNFDIPLWQCRKLPQIVLLRGWGRYGGYLYLSPRGYIHLSPRGYSYLLGDIFICPLGDIFTCPLGDVFICPVGDIFICPRGRHTPQHISSIEFDDLYLAYV